MKQEFSQVMDTLVYILNEQLDEFPGHYSSELKVDLAVCYQLAYGSAWYQSDACKASSTVDFKITVLQFKKIS